MNSVKLLGGGILFFYRPYKRKHNFLSHKQVTVQDNNGNAACLLSLHVGPHHRSKFTLSKDQHDHNFLHLRRKLSYMMALVMQLVFFLSVWVSVTVCDDVFKMENSSVQLDIQKKVEKFDDIAWKFNTKTFIVRFLYGKPPSRVYGSYKDRVEFNEETYSLTLKNVQKTDSGIYEARANDETEEVVAMYQLHVLDPVEKPVLTASLQSNDTCNVTLTCEAQKLSVTSHCYNDNCDMREKKTSGDMFPFLSLYVSKSFIICNHSNHVSWKNTSMAIKHVKQLCPNKEIKPEETSGHTTKNIIIICSVIVPVIFLVIIVIVVLCCQKKKADCQNRNTDAMPDSVNTIYEEVDAKNKGGKKAESVEMSENHAAPSTVYYTVGMQALAYSNDESTGMDTKVHPSYSKFGETHQYEGGQWNADSVDLPQTIYSTVKKPGKPVREA
ncbi:SLAM family member 7-like isoform X1 [Tachysurus fulvidraco]|uniref:SLAM family member 7-like isoform X1 n=1 Tax=Tachysurus fulvidraco TaxID=1234273 RepID=UPI001FEF162B|nr:SLAM family member 7-like isoform X1 [Tachysurus fulvidraco]